MPQSQHKPRTTRAPTQAKVQGHGRPTVSTGRRDEKSTSVGQRRLSVGWFRQFVPSPGAAPLGPRHRRDCESAAWAGHPGSTRRPGNGSADRSGAGRGGPLAPGPRWRVRCRPSPFEYRGDSPGGGARLWSARRPLARISRFPLGVLESPERPDPRHRSQSAGPLSRRDRRSSGWLASVRRSNSLPRYSVYDGGANAARPGGRASTAGAEEGARRGGSDAACESPATPE